MSAIYDQLEATQKPNFGWMAHNAHFLAENGLLFYIVLNLLKQN